MIGRVRRLLFWVFTWCVLLMVMAIHMQSSKVTKRSDETLDLDSVEVPVWQGHPILKTIVANSIYYFSAIGILDEVADTYLGIVIIGWEENLSGEAPDIICYYTYRDGKHFTEHNAVAKPVYTYNEGSVVTFMCPLQDQNKLPLKAGLKLANQKENQYGDLLKIYYPKHQEGKLALCPKVAFGNLNQQKLIEWFEVQKLLGVDRVVILVMDRLNAEAVDVFHHYRRQGMVHIHPYENRKKKRHSMWPAYMTESMPALAHCWYSMRGYTYASVLDFDEFIVPQKRDTIKDLLQRLLAKVPNAATFCFHQKVFPTDQEFPKEDTYTDLGRHRYCSQIIQERAKHIYINNRSLYLRSTHSVLKKGNYQRLRVDYDDGLIYHYRRCPGYANCSLEDLQYEEGLLSYLPVLEDSLQRLRAEKPEFFQQWNNFTEFK